MRKIKEVLRASNLRQNSSHERSPRRRGSKGAVTNAVQRAVQKGLEWPLPADLDEAGLEALMYRKAAAPERYAQPDYAVIHQELKRKGVRAAVALGPEYEDAQGERVSLQPVLPALSRPPRPARPLDAPGASSRREAVHRLQRRWRRGHRPEERRDHTAEIFVATLGASKYAYGDLDADAAGLDRLEYPDARVLQAVPTLWVPDESQGGDPACRYEPEATSTYHDCAQHYGGAILPARPFHAKDKAAVEMSVLVVQRWILAPSQPPVLLAAGAESGDCRVADGPQSPAVQETARQPTHVRLNRSTGRR